MATELVAPAAVREVQVLAKVQGRRFTQGYKRRILQEADGLTKSGEDGALLRREGLYSSHLTAWRTARARRELSGPAPKRRGPKPRVERAETKRILELEREVRQLRVRAVRAEALVAIQKKVAALLGNDLPPSNEER